MITISPVKFNSSYTKTAANKQKRRNQTFASKASYNPNYYKPIVNKHSKAISFLGYNVHIVDGGNHATNMQHFAKAISDDMDIEMHDVRTNTQDPLIKQLGDLKQELKLLNQSKKDFHNEYVAITALASVPLLNIQDQFSRVMGYNKKLTPENIKANKKELLEFLKELYKYPDYYKEYIGYMDPKKQGIEYTYGVIQEINKLKAKGANVFVPSGHPQDETLKWMAGQRGLKPELYNYIATGYDKNNSINTMHKEIKDNNWYDFNLLSLSDANIVGVKGAKGAQDYMFAAYDTCVTDGERGVYNFSPVRKDGELIGYSYTDIYTNEYPYEEFPANDEIANLVKFVGKNLNEVVASTEEINKFKAAIKNYDTSNCANKLYPVYEVFSKEKISNNKIGLQGDYVDKSLKLFFRTNAEGKVIFPKCDCEGSGKPSVLSMWGSCFSVFNAIAKDIDIKNKQTENAKTIDFTHYGKPISKVSKDEYQYRYLLNEAMKNKDYAKAETLANQAIEAYKIVGTVNGTNIENIHEQLAIALMKQGKKEAAKAQFNTTINKYCELMLNDKHYHSSYYTEKIAELYLKVGEICNRLGEDYPVQICKEASIEIENKTEIGDKIIERRADGVEYIGDLFPNIKPY